MQIFDFYLAENTIRVRYKCQYVKMFREKLLSVLGQKRAPKHLVYQN